MDQDILFIVLTSTAFLTSILSGVIGMGGGIILLTVMASFLPPVVLIPIHAGVQFVSNSSRVVLNYRGIRWKIALLTTIGAALGVGLASQLFVELPENVFKIVLGSFILLLTWAPLPKSTPRFPGKFFFLGGMSGFLGMFIGATGPLLAPFYLREGFTKVELVVNKAVAQLITHFLKIIAFVGMGFAFPEHGPLMASMSVATILGSLVGRHLLLKLPEAHFKTAFRVLITILSLRLIIVAVEKMYG